MSNSMESELKMSSDASPSSESLNSDIHGEILKTENEDKIIENTEELNEGRESTGETSQHVVVENNQENVATSTTKTVVFPVQNYNHFANQLMRSVEKMRNISDRVTPVESNRNLISSSRNCERRISPLQKAILAADLLKEIQPRIYTIQDKVDEMTEMIFAISKQMNLLEDHMPKTEGSINMMRKLKSTVVELKASRCQLCTVMNQVGIVMQKFVNDIISEYGRAGI